MVGVYGGSFMYHLKENDKPMVSIGYVVNFGFCEN
jgi:hypothetical protein